MPDIVVSFRVEKATAETALSLPETPIQWGWEGKGLTGWITSQRPDAITLNNPINGVDRIQSELIRTPMQTVKNQFFNSIGDAKFQDMSMGQNTTYLLFDLNGED